MSTDPTSNITDPPWWRDGEGVSLATTLVSAAVITVGVLGIMAGFNRLLFGGAGFFAGLLSFDFVQGVGEDVVVNGLIRIAVGVAQVVGGIGMLMIRRWGWWTALIATGAMAVNRLLGILAGGFGPLDLLGAAGLVVPGILLAAMLLPGIRNRYDRD
jgi:hypothetical protein